jgi:hypothetical protein
MVGRLAIAAWAALLWLAPLAARAQEGSPGAPPGDDTAVGGPGEARAKARVLANDGLAAFRRGDYVTALGKFEQAEAIVPAPTIALHRARCLEKLGRLAEALERFQAIVDAPVAQDAPYVHHRAKQDAQLEVQALEPRVPAVSIVVEGDPGSRAELVVDGRSSPVPPNATRVDRRLDPGAHTFELRRRDGTRATGKADLRERDRAEVRLSLPPPRPGAQLDEDEAPPAPAASEPDGIGWNGDEQRTAGWALLSAGGVGLGIALVSGVAAISVGGDLSERCPDGVCPPDATPDVDRHDGYRAASTVGFIFAGTFAAAGVALLLTAPDDGPRASASVGPRGASLRVDY